MDYHIRITPPDTDTTLQQVYNFFDQWSEQFIVSAEYIPHIHFHCHVHFQTPFTRRSKEKFAKILKTTFNVEKAQYYIAEVKGNSEAYTVKDGSFLSKGYSPEQMTHFRSQSRSKHLQVSDLYSTFDLSNTFPSMDLLKTDPELFKTNLTNTIQFFHQKSL